MSPQALAELIALYETRYALMEQQRTLPDQKPRDRAIYFGAAMTYAEVIADLQRFAKTA